MTPNDSAETVSPPTPSPTRSASQRLVSLDALRGFDMIWIMGGDSIGHAVAILAGGGAAKALADQLEHAPWEGFRFYDLIFPLFVFIIGVSLVFSLGRIVTAADRQKALGRVLRRTVLLYVLGLLYYGGLAEGWDRIRLMGVLQRLALCYFFAALLFLYCSPRTLAVVFAGLLLGYWALMALVPVPGVGAGNYAEGQNLANYVDARYLPLWKWESKPYDPEGLLSTLPAIASCLLGVFAGMRLRNRPQPDLKNVLWLLGCGVACLALGWLWSPWFPVIKKLWTSSYVLVAGGWSFILLGVFHWIVDLRGISRWAQPFIWIGMNPIAIYIASNVVSFDQLAKRFVGGEISEGLDARLGEGAGELLVSLVGISLCLWLARALYRRKIFLRL